MFVSSLAQAGNDRNFHLMIASAFYHSAFRRAVSRCPNMYPINDVSPPTPRCNERCLARSLLKQSQNILLQFYVEMPPNATYDHR